ncbi:hypothetical protein DICPUDRAFT_154675 [Dictyostelium purpureum]|uniref:HTH cro/C1-type domain-containing protein n=1 Tax=Dictyostelium purpureum TaxID=5786 RepID=F0ZRY8_DICPU|nr:uncharacterized protein DICPUDRAFT_154675 [Dictyostelium purpureum]EGC33278.1 hypothetical protein DICPUDRAFT_154675 [Dictyostelium purpureum]|eukprot:XP_003290179.1 hypothetical protein DICPUDRAFT_154675 [Dictyostelium purpureum]
MNRYLNLQYGAGTNKILNGVNQKKIEEADEDAALPELKASVPKAISKARNDLKMTQKDLAFKVNERPSVINDYENGTAIPSQPILAKLEKALNVKLRGKDVGKPLKADAPAKK